MCPDIAGELRAGREQPESVQAGIRIFSRADERCVVRRARCARTHRIHRFPQCLPPYPTGERRGKAL